MSEEPHQDLWPYVLTLLPSDLDGHARAHGALRRARGVRDAGDLLRMFLAYGLTTQPLKGVVAWAAAVDLAAMSAPALFYRLQTAGPWLSALLAHVLTEAVSPGSMRTNHPLRMVDATTVNGPGAKGTEWRVHACADPVSGRLQTIEITDPHGGESLTRHAFHAGDLVVADRGYAHASGIAATLREGANVLVRVNLANVRLCDANRQKIDWRTLEPQVPTTGAVEFVLWMPEPPLNPSRSHKPWPLRRANSWSAVRVIAARPRVGHIIWLLTTATTGDLDAVTALAVYRLRWQIELLFKRLKSLLSFDALPSRTEPLARSWILARLLAAALIERLIYREPALSPWGYRIVGR